MVGLSIASGIDLLSMELKTLIIPTNPMNRIPLTAAIVSCFVCVGAADDYTIARIAAQSGFAGQSCWVHARVGIVDSAGDDQPLAVMTTQRLLLSGSDVFYALHELRSSDGGSTWSDPERIEAFARQTFQGQDQPLPTGADIAPDLLRPGDETTVCDFVPQWHAATKRLLGIGQTVWYRKNSVMHVRPRGVAYAVRNPSGDWSNWKCLELPDKPEFQSAGAGSLQRVDLASGEILLPIYFKRSDATQYSVTVCRCTFDGQSLSFLEHGNVMSVPIKRGLYEPSIVRLGQRFFLTLRNDLAGYVCGSQDGLHFGNPQKWLFDDGADLGNYNTQQHWVTHDDDLYLVYTRRGLDNDHVFRHRAPLMMAKVDQNTLRVIRSSERVIVPQRGARLGNFGVTRVSADQTWIVVAEWMQPKGVEKHGSDNTIWVAKLKWNR